MKNVYRRLDIVVNGALDNKDMYVSRLPKLVNKVHGHEHSHYTKHAADEGICIRMLREAVLLVESSLVGRYESLSGGL
jgi:hypothetical protein